MVKVRASHCFTFKPELYSHILHKNIEYMEDCEIIRSFNTQEFLAKGLIQPKDTHFVYLYQQEFLGCTTLGLLAELSLQDYLQKKIKKHEKTLIRPHLNENTYAKDHVGPVIVAHEPNYELDSLLLHIRDQNAPFASWATVDGRQHQLWQIHDSEKLLSYFVSIPNMYILDGHHRFEAAASHLEKLGESAPQKAKWIQGLIYSTKYIRTYPQFRKLVHQQNRNIIRQIMANEKLIVEQLVEYDPNDQELQIVLLQDGNFFHIKRIQDIGMACSQTGVEKLDDILQHAMKNVQNQSKNPIKYIPSIMFKMDNLETHSEPVFLVKSPCINTIFSIANQDRYLPPKSTWLQPKPCLHMVIRVPF